MLVKETLHSQPSPWGTTWGHNRDPGPGGAWSLWQGWCRWGLRARVRSRWPASAPACPDLLEGSPRKDHLVWEPGGRRGQAVGEEAGGEGRSQIMSPSLLGGAEEGASRPVPCLPLSSTAPAGLPHMALPGQRGEHSERGELRTGDMAGQGPQARAGEPSSSRPRPLSKPTHQPARSTSGRVCGRGWGRGRGENSPGIGWGRGSSRHHWGEPGKVRPFSEPRFPQV